MIEIIICTFNRPQKVVGLVHSLLAHKADFKRIIVVDSSDITNAELEKIDEVLYLKSKHKNQPYQRYLGYLSSSSEFLLYLDDDMEIACDDFMQILKDSVNSNFNLAGIAICFEDKHSKTTLSEVPKSLWSRNNGLISFIRWMTFYPTLPSGRLGYCGIRGKQPQLGGSTEWLSGGAFLANREMLFKNFNFQMFDLFEKKMGMGEDALIGYGLSKQGKLLYLSNLLFYHNDQRDSSYSINQYEFAKRVIYSRLFLSLEKSRLDGKGTLFPYFYFHVYALFRICGQILNLSLIHI